MQQRCSSDAADPGRVEGQSDQILSMHGTMVDREYGPGTGFVSWRLWDPNRVTPGLFNPRENDSNALGAKRYVWHT